MSKGLEAYEIVKEECGYAFGQTANGDRVRKNLPIIEKELKEGEKDHELKETQGHYYDIQFKKSKKEKAFDIISKKGIIVNGLIKSKDLEEYNILCLNHGMTELLTQEEYDLLKEVLINEKES